MIQKAWEYAQYNNLIELKEIVPSIVSPNSSTKSETNYVQTLLMAAVSSGAEDTCLYLLEQGADVNKQNFNGFSALHWAAFCGRTECLEKLVLYKALFDLKDIQGRAPIHIASERGHLQFIKKLLELGADINEISSISFSALHYSIISNQKAVSSFLINHGIDTSILDINMHDIIYTAKKYKRNWAIDLLKPVT